MPRNIDTALIRTFVAVADHASMTAAANVLNLTQGAVSQQVRRLEESLGGTLLDRDRRGQSLTPLGERLVGKARQMLTLNDEIWREISAQAAQGRIRFGVPHDLAGVFMTSVLKGYAEAYPRVEISLICAASPELIDALARGAIDLAVVEEPVGPTNGECLALERLVWVGAAGGRAHLKRPLPLSMVAETCAFRPGVLSALRDGGIEWRTVFESGSADVTAATVRADLAVTVWLANGAPPDLAILGPDHGLPTLPPFAVNLHLRKAGSDSATSALARHIRERFAWVQPIS